MTNGERDQTSLRDDWEGTLTRSLPSRDKCEDPQAEPG